MEVANFKQHKRMHAVALQGISVQGVKEKHPSIVFSVPRTDLNLCTHQGSV